MSQGCTTPKSTILFMFYNPLIIILDLLTTYGYL